MLRKNWRDFRKELEKFVEKDRNKTHLFANHGGWSVQRCVCGSALGRIFTLPHRRGKDTGRS